MPLYMDLHTLPPGATDAEMANAHQADIANQDQFGAKVHTYWLNRESNTANCLMTAPSAEKANALHRASHGMVAEELIEVNEAVAEAFMGRIDQTAAALDHATTQAGSSLRVILFTDIVGSTQMTRELGDAAAMEILRGHDKIVRDALQKQNGREVKHTGDGIMASFSSVAGSINSAIEIQQAVNHQNEDTANHKLNVKIGLSAGEPVQENQDFFGSSVQLAARICDYAKAHEILTTNTVHELCIGKGFDIESIEEKLFKGFDEPTRISRVSWKST